MVDAFCVNPSYVAAAGMLHVALAQCVGLVHTEREGEVFAQVRKSFARNAKNGVFAETMPASMHRRSSNSNSKSPTSPGSPGSPGDSSSSSSSICVCKFVDVGREVAVGLGVSHVGRDRAASAAEALGGFASAGDVVLLCDWAAPDVFCEVLDGFVARLRPGSVLVLLFKTELSSHPNDDDDCDNDGNQEKENREMGEEEEEEAAAAEGEGEEEEEEDEEWEDDDNNNDDEERKGRGQNEKNATTKTKTTTTRRTTTTPSSSPRGGAAGASAASTLPGQLVSIGRPEGAAAQQGGSGVGSASVARQKQSLPTDPMTTSKVMARLTTVALPHLRLLDRCTWTVGHAAVSAAFFQRRGGEGRSSSGKNKLLSLEGAGGSDDDEDDANVSAT